MRLRHPAGALALALLAASCTGAAGPGDPAASATSPADPPGTTGTQADSPDVEEIASEDALPGIATPTLDVGRYDLDLRYEPATRHLEGTATIDVRAAIPLGAGDHPTVDLGLGRFDISRVQVDGRDAEHTWSENHLRVTPPDPIEQDQRFVVSVTYAGVPQPIPTAALPGIRVGWQAGRDGSVVMAEPEGARSWFPANDHPLDKATFAIAVSVPGPYTAVASGRLVATEVDRDASGPRSRRYRWVMDEPMAPYLATVVTGQLNEVAVSEQDGVTYSSWLPVDAEVDLAVATGTPALVQHMAARLGPFPFSTYGAVVFPPGYLSGADPRTQGFLSGVALETQGRSLYAESTFAPEVVVHETAHQWFGDNVSVTDWGEDIWWVEGFATFAEAYFPFDGPPVATVAKRTFERAYPACQGHSVTDLVAAELFESSYECGALVFYALHEEAGDEAFWRILRTFQERHRHANATTEDLVAVTRDVGGRALADSLQRWMGPDLPPLPS